ncbi:NAD(P)/FAD-dependent oxidoreductase [Desertibacillus haloalkaliphilus]|uniref:NAD(P)/FAD-dependent oxidoreductase n=1 Tax=Desertibacillus haloalkaliphilus TaxID=1328930 RepID=UPI001C257693|nr:NAD(P)/FAD-dependent oxidoreductase [Desertibacillus haloalkaliphilus]MBU8907796.1 NAD(P)/FAD-dependent oxidoreductase [Desertibacillus haloalkaliphilus]
MTYDCLIIGGGIAGLQAAIQLGRYDHSIAVIDAGGGRSSLCRNYHNLLGWPDGVSGDHFRSTGQKQAKQFGVHFINDKAIDIKKDQQGFAITLQDDTICPKGKTLLFATGITERLPDLPALLPCLGHSVYICPDCDGYEIKQKKTIVIGSGKAGANLSRALRYWSDEITFVNHEKINVPDEVVNKLAKENITIINEEVKDVHTKDQSQFTGITLVNGEKIEAFHAFLAMGNNQVNSGLAKRIGVERLENKHINVNPRTKQTNIPDVWAVGDVVAHSQLLSVAMGDGAQAAIWIHKRLLQGR